VLTRLGLTAHRWIAITPWTNVYGLARTILALATLGTLALSPPGALFAPALGAPPPPYCGNVAGISLFCVVPESQLNLARLVGIAILVVVASGWRPRITALPHWWVAFSLQASISIPDGGDHVTEVLTLLLVPVALSDRRRWHWSAPRLRAGAERPIATLVALVTMVLVRVQVAGIYLHSSLGKLGTTEWTDGTAIYYWLDDPTFGTPMWLRGTAQAVLSFGPAVAALTWGTLALEFALAVAIFVPKRRWQPFLLGGLALHAGIAVLMGLGSFALAMFAALTLYLRPWEKPFSLHPKLSAGFDRLLRRAVSNPRVRPAPRSARPAPETG
jgi:antimicrobial peptide system SdpB family protein